MRFKQVAMLLAAGSLSGCSPAGNYAGILPANADPSATREMLSNLQKAGCRTRARRVGTGGTDVTICAIAGAHNQSTVSAPSTGVIVATLTNVGSVPDDRWRLEPGRTYYLRVFGSGSFGTPGKYDIRSFTEDSWDTAVASGDFIPCTGPKHPRQNRSHAGYATCSDDSPADAEDPALVSANPSGGPAWITCAEGCCTTDLE